MSTLVLHYGLLAPTSTTAHLVNDELMRAHRFRNRLIEIEIARRTALRELELVDAEIVAARESLAAKLDSFGAAAKARGQWRAQQRTREPAPAEMEAAYGEAKRALEEARNALRTAQRRLRATDEYKMVAATIQQQSAASEKLASSESGVAWGTKQRHQMAMDASRSMKARGDGKPPPGALWDDLEPHNPRFRTFDQCGILGVQVQGGIGFAELAQNTQLQIELCPTSASGRGRRFAVLRLRIGSDAKRSPVWGEWPLFLDRPLPPGCRILRVGVDRIRRGERIVWELNVTVEKDTDLVWTGSVGWVRIAQRMSSSVGVDLGWRVIGNEIRVCAWVGDDGRHGELRLTANHIEAVRRAERIRGHRDRHFNAVCRWLRRWMKHNEHPEWLDDATATMSQWRAPQRLFDLTYQWARFPGDEQIVSLLMLWRQKERHLRTYEAEQRQQGLDRRTDLYRCFAKRLAAEYDIAVLEDFDLRRVANRSDKDDAQVEIARSNRQLACVSELRSAIVNAFLRCGGYQKVPAAGTTQTCAKTKTPEPFDAAPKIEHACGCGCGMTWDQDLNAAKNILRRGCEREGDSQDPGVARKYEIVRQSTEKREGRFQRLKRLKAEKEAQKLDAREANDKAAE